MVTLPLHFQLPLFHLSRKCLYDLDLSMKAQMSSILLEKLSEDERLSR